MTNLRVALVRVERGEQARLGGVSELVRARMPRERRVVALDVEREVLFQAVAKQEGVRRRGVVVVLVLRFDFGQVVGS